MTTLTGPLKPFGSSIAKGLFGRCAVCARPTGRFAPLGINPHQIGGKSFSTDASGLLARGVARSKRPVVGGERRLGECMCLSGTGG